MSKRDPVTHRTPEQTKAHYRDYQGKPEQIAKRSLRNQARRSMEAAGKVRKGDGMDVDHKKPLRAGGAPLAKGNLRVVPKARNRGWKDGV